MAHPRFLLSLQRRPAPQSSGLSGRREPWPWHSVQSPPADAGVGTGTGTVRGGRTREPQQQLLQGPEAILSPGRGAFQTGLRSDGPGRRALRAVAVVAAWGQAFPCTLDRVRASVVTGVQGLGRRGPLQAADAAEGRRGAFSVPASSHPPGATARLSPPPGCTAENAGWRKGAPQTGPGSRRGEQSRTVPQRPQRLPRRTGARGPRGACVVAVSSPTPGAGVPRCLPPSPVLSRGP